MCRPPLRFKSITYLCGFVGVGYPKLREPEPHGAAILAWCVEGLTLWRKKGLTTPQGVLDATEAYRGDMDALAEFADLHLEFGDHDVYQATP